ncbi:NmrA family NAD(P)-binding protein [Pseudomonas brassicacearum]|uniref:NmrA family NAD(P)-binding protein n=1 Tax=Pseudomonas brassicacearum TaxID=930166 RepID=UPI001BDF3F2C|nr:NAD(P)H-binding protein [Pseudomonas brassicacearum]
MIVVTAPTSNIGSQVLERLLAERASVRVIARDPSRLPAHTLERVEVVAGSHSDDEVVDRAFRGADSVFWLVPPDPRALSVEAAYLDFSQAACRAIKRHAVGHVVGVSGLGRGVAGNAGLVSASLAMDDLIASTGVNYRALAMPTFMDNILRHVDSIRDAGVFYSPVSGDLKLPICATRDIAAVAAKLLMDRDWTGYDDVPVLGPEDVSFNDMAQIISEVLGKPVRFQQVAYNDFKDGLLGAGMSPAMAQGVLDMMVAKNNGLDKAQLRTPQSTTPTHFRQWCEEVLKPAVLR